MNTLFDELHVGSLQLKNRFVMAPLTRMRSQQPGNIPWELNAEYYRQRASAGLIVTEATQVSQQGQGYPGTPGIHSPDQVAGWRKVTGAVHDAGGRIFLQLWHVGRISHRSFQPGNQLPVSASAVKPAGITYTASWQPVDFETPRALRTDEIPGVIGHFRQAASNAMDAGFDGVEIHGANGYLIDQFLQDGTNRRTDQYGGSLQNRTRFLLEVVSAVAEVWEMGRIGVRLSPFGTFNDMSDSDANALFTHVVRELDSSGIGYLHLVEPRASEADQTDAIDASAQACLEKFRPIFRGILVSAGGYTPESAAAVIRDGLADAVAFGRLFIANPDLPERVRSAAGMNPYDRTTFYGGDARGYTDYPLLSGA